MTESEFQSEMKRAQAMQRIASDPNQSAYYAGYMRGLRRAFHGEQFGTADEHEVWLGLVGDGDESRNQQGLGYLAGLAAPAVRTKFEVLNEPQAAARRRRMKIMTKTKGTEVVCETPNGREIRLNHETGKYEVQPKNDNYWIKCDTEEAAYRAYDPRWNGENHDELGL